MTVKLLLEQLLEFLSLKGSCTGSYESALVEMPHCWIPHVMAQFNQSGNSVGCVRSHSDLDLQCIEMITLVTPSQFFQP